jgi:hypothetical protein
MSPTTVYRLPTKSRTEPLAKQGDLCMLWAEGIRVSRMREGAADKTGIQLVRVQP